MNIRNVIIYLVIVITLILVLVLSQDINDMLEMIIYATILVVTSIFTYSNRRKK
jgi:hypothetical protein